MTLAPARPLIAAAIAAAALPSLLAFNPPPSPTFLNQALAIAAWGVFAGMAGGRLRDARSAWTLLAALAAVAAAAAWSWGPGTLPASLALSALGMLAATVVMVAGGAAAGTANGAGSLGGARHAAGNGLAAAAPTRDDVFAAFCWGWVVAGALNAGIGALQVFAPGWPDGDWIARSGLPGRAVGNLRQPNHLSSLLLWAAIATVGLLQMRRLRPWPARGLFAAMMLAVVLTASRTGLVSVLLLAAWGLLDRGLGRPARRLLVAAPVLYALAWGGMWLWAQGGEHAFGGQARLQETDISSSRFGIWANTLAMIAREPWTGTGFGEYNLAWSMTAFPGRPTAFFDHAHNLPLHLAAELGLPLAGAVLALLCAALWLGWRRSGGGRTAARCAWMFVLMIGVHSLLEYPLWYAYFLLPAAWAWGHALGEPARGDAFQGVLNSGRNSGMPADVRAGMQAGMQAGVQAGVHAGPAPRWAPRVALLLVIGSMAAALDYTSVTRIFEAGGGQAPLAQRVADGRRSVLFSHHADYAAATTGLPQPDGLGAFDGAKHYLLDTRLMVAWADALAAAGQTEAARHVAERLREFGSARAADFFEECAKPASAAAAYQCQPPKAGERPLGWRELAGSGP